MKKLFSLLLILLLVTPAFGSTTFADNTVKAKVAESSTFFNGEEKHSNGFAILGNNYYSLRDIAEHFSGTSSQFDITQ